MSNNRWGASGVPMLPVFDAATNKKARYDDRASVCGCPPRKRTPAIRQWSAWLRERLGRI